MAKTFDDFITDYANASFSTPRHRCAWCGKRFVTDSDFDTPRVIDGDTVCTKCAIEYEEKEEGA